MFLASLLWLVSVSSRLLLTEPFGFCFVVQVDKNMLFDLVAAANYMDIKPLLDLTCLAVSMLIKGKSASELRAMFNIAPELTTEEAAAQNTNSSTRQAEEEAADVPVEG
jgi:hypothetical protein